MYGFLIRVGKTSLIRHHMNEFAKFMEWLFLVFLTQLAFSEELLKFSKVLYREIKFFSHIFNKFNMKTD